MALDLFKPFSSISDKRSVCQLFFNDDFQHSVCERGVCSRLDFQMQVGDLGRCRFAGIDDNDVGPVLLRFFKIRHDRRLALCDIRTCEDDDPCMGDLGKGICQPPVHSKGLICSCSGRRHAKPAVVVNMLRLQGDAGELPQQIRFFVCNGRAAVYTQSIAAIFMLDRCYLLFDVLKRFIPCHTDEVAVFFDQRMGDPLRMKGMLVGVHPFHAQPSFCRRIVFSDRRVLFSCHNRLFNELHFALHAAKWTLGVIRFFGLHFFLLCAKVL